MGPFNRLTILAISGLTITFVAIPALSPGGSRDTTASAPVRVWPTYITDFGDDRRLAGAVDNIFVGRVIAQSGSAVFDSVPETQFQVEVLETIKGSLKGKVVVNQEGGKDGDRLVLVDDDPLLKAGQTYLFATRLYPERGWQTLVSRYGDIVITDARQRASLVERFKKATREQIPYRPE